MKSIIKEIIIILLLLLAILLVLGVFLYDYIPTNKIVPKVEQYQLPNSIKEEINESITDIEEGSTQIVYEIDGTDLKNYEKTKDYQKGKANPFEQATTSSTTNETNTNKSSNTVNANDTNSTDTTNTTNTTASNSNSVGNYLPSTGIK